MTTNPDARAVKIAGKRYAFIKDNIPEIAPKVMVVIVEETQTPGVGCVVEAMPCDPDDVARYVQQQIGDCETVWKPQ